MPNDGECTHLCLSFLLGPKDSSIFSLSSLVSGSFQLVISLIPTSIVRDVFAVCFQLALHKIFILLVIDQNDSLHIMLKMTFDAW